MIILGINFSHDAAVALVKDGELLFAIEEEKISRVKQDFGWPENAIREALKTHEIKPNEIDIIAFGSLFYSSIAENEIKYRFSKNKTDKNLEIIDRLTSFIGLTEKKINDKNKEVFKKAIKAKGFINAQVKFFNHHLSHAASAYYCSPIQQDLVITADGHGDGESFNFYKASKEGLEVLVSNDHSTSVGQFYSTITKLLGFRPTRHEGKITGLAAYGKETALVEKFNSLFYYEDNRLRRYPNDKLDKLYKEFEIRKKLEIKAKINLKTSESEIGYDYARSALVLEEWLRKETKNHSKEDIAYACQIASENCIVNETKRVYEKYYENQKINIALAGGVFANVRINQKLYELPFVDNIFVQPAMGDSGLALGAAILASLSEKKDKEHYDFQFQNTYHGPEYGAQLKALIEKLKKDKKYEITVMSEPAKEIANKLKDNKIIGFWHGRMEWGPRALGSRSILLNTFDKSVNDSLNDRLNRTEFMPFAPVVLDKFAKTYFPEFDEKVPAAEYMTITYDTNPEYHEELQAVVHIDGTARPQVIKRELNPYYYDILEEFQLITGCAALVNTSFNAHEEPIVSTPESALNALNTNRIDILVMDNFLLNLRKNSI